MRATNKDKVSVRLIYLAAAWSGFFIMGIELLGGRILAPYFGSSIFVWGGIIAVFMLCMAGGYVAGGQWSRQEPSMSKLAVLLLAAAVACLPVLIFGGTALEYLSYLLEDPRFGSLLASFLLFGAPTFVSGMVAPYSLRLLVESLEDSGRSAGNLYALSTLGSAAGTILTSFFLVLYFEINTIIMSFVGTSIVAALTLLAKDRQGSYPWVVEG